MALTDKLSFGSAIVAGGIKGFSDGVGIDLHALDYILLPLGISTPPLTNLFLDDEHKFWFTDGLQAGLAVGVSYALGRTIGYITNHYS